MKFFRRQQSLLSLFFHLSLCPFLSHSLKLSPSSPASLLLPSHPPLSLSLPSVCTLFLPRFFFVSQLFQLLSLSLYRWTWMQNTVCWVHLGVSAVWRGANQSAALQSHSFSWISTLRSLISTYIKTTSRSYAISFCLGMLYIKQSAHLHNFGCCFRSAFIGKVYW